jgi:hypothetical protein
MRKGTKKLHDAAIRLTGGSDRESGSKYCAVVRKIVSLHQLQACLRTPSFKGIYLRLERRRSEFSLSPYFGFPGASGQEKLSK